MSDLTLAFIGGGNMAEALIKGVLASGMGLEPTHIHVADPQEARRTYLTGSYGVTAHADNKAALKGARLVILAVKPQMIDQVLKEIQDDIADGQVVVSIAAGVTIQRIQGHLYADSKVVRVMPNTPSLVGEGASAVTPGPGVTPAELSTVREVLAAVGSVVVVAEEQMDAVTALSGSGPAYVFTMIEALADGGVKMGLSRDVAMTLAAQTVLGAGRMVLSTATHPAALKDMVTSPGGTTAAGLHVLEKAGFRGAVIGAVEAAALRARELGS
ncbi:MAG: pyrroline-5-carboxylate reductase [Nitrospirota bacterium]|nr:pyrroline-5-carboxylate reductase [Nitrospirota bacterium]